MTKPTGLHEIRGGSPQGSDADLLAAIRADLAASPFVGEGHRKVWARLRLAGIGVARKRVCRVMHEDALLSPHRTPKGTPDPHTGTIITEAPDAMWGTDGVRIETVDDGWVWVFSAVDHFNAECVGWHAAKIGNRFAALEPIAQGLTRHFGATGADVARGLSLRFDHGSQYMADHFLNQVKFWGITTSPAFVAEPRPTAWRNVSTAPSRSSRSMAASSAIWRPCARLCVNSLRVTTRIGVSKNSPACHPGKLVRRPFSGTPPDV